MRNKKTIVIGVLCALVAIMAVGYAALATQLNITGTASIDSIWKVEITNITERDVVGDATSKETPSYTATTANFSVGLIQPTDSITYDIEVSNLGTLKAKVDSINVMMDENDAITYTTEGLAEGDKLGVGEKDTLSVTVAYNPEVTSQPTDINKDITVTINYVQDIDGGNAVDPTPDVQEPTGSYETYSIGDRITFAGSDWYVIKDSSSAEDYVTLLKEKTLTKSELGEYAQTASNQMQYYWSDTCHSSGMYGYTDTNSSGCEGHNDYEGSKVREFLEGTYINTLGADNLKELDGYKIRLLKLDEITGDLGAENIVGSHLAISNMENVPTWIYDNVTISSYWTMTPNLNYSYHCWYVNSLGNLSAYTVTGLSQVRPVINLLKSSI